MWAGGSVEQLLVAWAAWARDDDHGLAFKARTGSAECLHVAPLGEVHADERPARVPLIPDDLGARVDREVARLRPALRALICRRYLREAPILLRDHAVLECALRELGELLAPRNGSAVSRQGRAARQDAAPACPAG